MSTKDPRETEATANVGVVEFRGHTFEVPLERAEWTLDFVESLEEGKSVGIVRGALGPGQWRVVRSLDLRLKDLEELSDKIAAAMGFGSTGE